MSGPSWQGADEPFPADSDSDPGPGLPGCAGGGVWLSEAFGFVERVRIGEDHRAQMRVGVDGAVIVADVRREQQPPQSGVVTHLLKVRVADVDVQVDRARAHGARVLQEPEEFEYGEREATVEDWPGTGGSSPRPSVTWRRRSGAASPSSPIFAPDVTGPVVAQLVTWLDATPGYPGRDPSPWSGSASCRGPSQRRSTPGHPGMATKVIRAGPLSATR
jgi:uncharacterized glyoxalase superfamily protein PhnB